ncbi:hypothetical protein D3C81_2215800 [compost metagenome]
MKVQRLVLEPGTGKPQNAPIQVFDHPATACVDKRPVCLAIHHVTLRQPGQCRPGGKGLRSRAFDAR